jgi:hypothetical protein
MSSAAIASPLLLREGDRLTSREFLRRWDAMPDLKQAELLDGIVFMPSPVSKPHGISQVSLGGWAWLYADQTPGCEAAADMTWLMTDSGIPQPGVSLRILPEYGGQSMDSGQFSAGAPELAVEVSGSTLSRELGVKLDLYRRAGVREYITVLLSPRQIIWRHLVRGKYRDLEADADGILHSRTFPGLCLDPTAAWDRKKSLRTALELGLKSPEHAAFVKKLKQFRAARQNRK